MADRILSAMGVGGLTGFALESLGAPEPWPLLVALPLVVVGFLLMPPEVDRGE